MCLWQNPEDCGSVYLWTMKSAFVLSSSDLGYNEVREIIQSGLILELSPNLEVLLQERRLALERNIQSNSRAYYGVNTGFGALCNTVIKEEELDLLQVNLVKSHACGFGEKADTAVVRLCLLLKIICLCKGYSGVRLDLIKFFIQLFNEHMHPVIPCMGSLGASGDLAPLAHLSLPCIGEGQMEWQGKIYPSLELLNSRNISIPFLKAKEGLALLNGTQFSLSLLLNALFSARLAYHQANMIASLSFEAFHCQYSFLHPEIHQLRRQAGQIDAAQEMRDWLKDSALINASGKSVQDPYSFRCAPQVHGACLDLITQLESYAANEINAVTDNPIYTKEGEIVSGGNFHAQILAFSSDILCLALCELANISERRLYQLVCGLRGLPDFLTKEAGLNSGYMIVQYAAAAAVSMNKQLASPSSVDSIISSKGQEDHVSMAANAGLKCHQIVKNTQVVLAMEWMTACRAIALKPETKMSVRLSEVYKNYQQQYPIIEEDHIPSDYYMPTVHFLNQLEFA